MTGNVEKWVNILLVTERGMRRFAASFGFLEDNHRNWKYSWSSRRRHTYNIRIVLAGTKHWYFITICIQSRSWDITNLLTGAFCRFACCGWAFRCSTGLCAVTGVVVTGRCTTLGVLSWGVRRVSYDEIVVVPLLSILVVCCWLDINKLWLHYTVYHENNW